MRKEFFMKKKLLSLILFTGILTCSLPVMAAPKIYDNTVFDAEYYAANNPDVVAVLGNDENALLQHYINSGMAEGRLGIDPVSDIHTKVVTPSAESLAKIADTSGDIEGIDYVVDVIPDVPELYCIYYRLGMDYLYVEEMMTLPKGMTPLTRTDFPDGLIDLDGNGIDDRDPINSMNVIDLNTNGIDDRTYFYYDGGFFDYEDDIGKSHSHKYICEHGVVNYGLLSDYYINDQTFVCPTCTANVAAEKAAREKKYKEMYAINSYDLGYRKGDTKKDDTGVIYTYTGERNDWISSKNNAVYEAVIQYGEFKGWSRWVY